ncbi:MAG: hypothetical protein ACI9GM_000017 [Salibacteraceae bacterium]|jgi:hypothetical protein
MKGNCLNYIYPFILVIAITALYHQVIFNGFSGLDDLLMIEENWDRLQHLSHIKTAFTEDVFIQAQGSYYRPIQLLSYMPDVYFSNSELPVAKVFFQINILFFILAFIQLFFFLKEFSFGIHYRFLFSLFMAIHPALTPAVSWIPGRIDTLLFIIIISAFWAFIRFIKTHKKRWVITYLTLFALGMFTKETAIIIPFISLLLVWFFQSQKNDSQVNEIWSWRKSIDIQFWYSIFKTLKNWIINHGYILLGWVVILVFYFYMRSNALDANSLGIRGMLFHLNNSWQEFIILGAITYLPIKLQVFLDITQPFVLYSIPAFLLFLAVPQFLKSRFNYTFFGLTWMLAFILPTTLSDSLNYHRMFIPFVGMAFVLHTLEFSRIKKSYLIIGLSFLFFWFLYQNIEFQKAYKNKSTFWNNAIESSPNSPFANNGLAWSFHMDHENDSALKYYARVVELRPQGENVRMGMALIYEEMGLLQQSDSLLKEEFKATNDSSSVYFCIGQLFLERGDTLAAIPHLNLGYEVTQYSRNARLYYDTLDLKVRNQLRLD